MKCFEQPVQSIFLAVKLHKGEFTYSILQIWEGCAGKDTLRRRK